MRLASNNLLGAFLIMNDFQLATITDGKYKGKNVAIIAELESGKCVVEFSTEEENQFDIVEATILRLWKSVESTATRST